MPIVNNDAAQAAMVHDYLSRLRAAGWGLEPGRRDELLAEVGEHIEQALRAEQAAGRHGEAAVRNVLERLGPPEEIVRAESEGQPYAVAGAPASPWGPVEIFAVLLLAVGSIVAPIVGPVVGLVLVWVSTQWSGRQKVVATVLGLLPALLPLVVVVARF